MTLFPLLPHHIARQVAEGVLCATIHDLANGAALEHPACTYTATGGTRATKATLLSLRSDLLRLAEAAGYPESPNQDRAAAFDATAAVALARHMPIAPAEAAKGALWEFLSCVVLPDLVRWRFGGADRSTAIERYLSGRRNTFQRLWWRAFHLAARGNDPAHMESLLRALGEDELVQLMERPSLAGIEGLPAAIAGGLLTVSGRHPNLTRRQLIREAQKRFLRLSSFVSLESISPEDVELHVTQIFDRVAETLLRAQST